MSPHLLGHLPHCALQALPTPSLQQCPDLAARAGPRNLPLFLSAWLAHDSSRTRTLMLPLMQAPSCPALYKLCCPWGEWGNTPPQPPSSSSGGSPRSTSQTWDPGGSAAPVQLCCAGLSSPSRPHRVPEAHRPCQGLGGSNPHPGWYLPRLCPSKSSVGTRWRVCGLRGPLPLVLPTPRMQSLRPSTDFSFAPLGFCRGGWGLQIAGTVGAKLGGRELAERVSGGAPTHPVPLLLALVQLSVVVGQG